MSPRPDLDTRSCLRAGSLGEMVVGCKLLLRSASASGRRPGLQWPVDVPLQQACRKRASAQRSRVGRRYKCRRKERTVDRAFYLKGKSNQVGKVKIRIKGIFSRKSKMPCMKSESLCVSLTMEKLLPTIMKPYLFTRL